MHKIVIACPSVRMLITFANNIRYWSINKGEESDRLEVPPKVWAKNPAINTCE